MVLVAGMVNNMVNIYKAKCEELYTSERIECRESVPACFVVSSQICTVTRITCDVSSGYFPYGYQSFDVSIPKSVNNVMVNAYRIMINIYVKIS